jgi:hypothetical protein
MPGWLHVLAIAFLVIAGLCFLIVLADLLAGHRQHMWIMNVVWPITMLYSGPLGLWFYFRAGRMSGPGHHGVQRPEWQNVSLATTHCGSGCTLGDIVAEWIMFAAPITLFRSKLISGWTLDYILAFAFGIAFQYFTIKPMKGLSVKDGILTALKADTFSLTAWQVGMYGWMAIVVFVIFGRELEKTDPVFWFMMQIAMLVGFLTSYPVNRWLLNEGIKEPM